MTFGRKRRLQLEGLRRRKFLHRSAGLALPSRARLQFGAPLVVESGVQHALMVIFGINSALPDQPLGDRIESGLAAHAKVEERTRLFGLCLRPD